MVVGIIIYRFPFFMGWGGVCFFSALAGIVLISFKDVGKALALIAFPLVYYFFIGRSRIAFVRYALPLVPFFCITGAVFAVEVSEKLKGYVAAGLRRWVLVLVIVAVILPSAVSVFKFNKLIAREDSRLLAMEWINDNFSVKSSIYQTGSWLGQVQLFESRESLERRLGELGREDLNSTGIALQARIDYLEKGGDKWFDQWKFEEEKKKFIFEGEEVEGFPQYIVLYETPVDVDKMTSPVSEDVIEILEEEYSLVKAFEVVDLGELGNIYDHQDAFYIPYFGFEGIERPGPNIYIHERISI